MKITGLTSPCCSERDSDKGCAKNGTCLYFVTIKCYKRDQERSNKGQ
jgi:hypothetical protein